jgi:hypothetical protein
MKPNTAAMTMAPVLQAGVGGGPSGVGVDVEVVSSFDGVGAMMCMLREGC